jgi:hypothetical protein
MLVLLCLFSSSKVGSQEMKVTRRRRECLKMEKWPMPLLSDTDVSVCFAFPYRFFTLLSLIFTLYTLLFTFSFFQKLSEKISIQRNISSASVFTEAENHVNKLLSVS